MGYSEFLHSSRIICLPLNITEKLPWQHFFETLEEAETQLCWYDTIPTHPEEQHLPFKQTGTITIFSFWYQSCAWPPSSPFYWQNPCSGCKREIDLVIVLEYTFFKLCFNDEQISRYTRFRRSYVNRHCCSDQPLSKLYCFSAWFALFKAAMFLFWSCLSPMIVHLCKLFLLSTPVTECYELQGG